MLHKKSILCTYIYVYVVLSTPQVRSLCLPFLLLGRRTSPYGFSFVQGGFVLPKRETDGALKLEAFGIIGGTEKQCTDSFEQSYNTTSSHVFCGKAKAGTRQKSLEIPYPF
jgi:hypothetical protein